MTFAIESYFMELPNRVNNRFEEGFLVKVCQIEYSSLRQSIVDGNRVAASCLAERGKGKEDFHIFLQNLFLDRLLKFHHLCPRIGDCKNHTIVRHVFQGDLDS